MNSDQNGEGREPGPVRPSVSVIVPAYNCEEFIELSVRSILAQQWGQLEIIIINDRSTDNSWAKIEWLAQEHAEVVVCHNERSKGPSGARNTGLDRATGDYIAFLDADDVWLPGHLEQGVEYLETATGVGVVFFNFDLVDFRTEENLGDWFSRGTELRKLKTRTDDQDFQIIEDELLGPFLQESFLHLQSMIIRSSAGQGLRFDENAMYGEDCDFAIKLAVEAAAEFAFKDLVTGIYYRHENSLTTNSDESQTAEDIEKTVKRIDGYIHMLRGYGEKYELNNNHRALIAGSLYRRYLTKSFLYRKLGRFGDSWQSLKSSRRYGEGGQQLVEALKLSAAAIAARLRRGQ